VVQTAKKLVAEKGILSSPNIKLGKMLPTATPEMKHFYVCDEISMFMPGTKGYIYFTSEGKK
jgi:hypothetical protein